MAAIDTFHFFNASISDKDRQHIHDLLKTESSELLAARSEDARIRIVEGYMQQVRSLLGRFK